MSRKVSDLLSVRIEAGSLTTDNVTGVGYYTASLVEAMSRLPHVAVDVFTLGTQEVTLSKHLGGAGVRSVYHVPSLNRRLYRKLFQYFVAPPCDTTLPPVDVTIYPDFALWPTVHSTLSGVVIHDLTFIKYPEYMRARKIGPVSLPVTTWYLASVVRKSVRRADFVVTVSESTKAELIALLGVDKEKILVTPIPPRENFKLQAQNPCSREEILKKYRIETPDYILSVGTLEPRKNYTALLNAYLQLPDTTRARYTLVIAGGEGWGCEETLGAIREAQHRGEHVVLTGYFDTKDGYNLYAHATLFSSASHYEGFGMPLLEALYAGTPLVVADIPVFREVAGGAARYVDTSDTAQYSATLLDTLSDKGLRGHLSSLGKKRLSMFSWERNASAIETLCRHLLDK